MNISLTFAYIFIILVVDITERIKNGGQKMTQIIAASREKKQEVINRISSAVERIIDAPELSDLTDEQIEQLTKVIVVDNLKDTLKLEVEKAKVNVDELKEDWLRQFNSSETKRSFQRNLDNFLHWLGNKSILDVNAKIVDEYITYLHQRVDIKNNTKRQAIAACSSFWSHLVRWDIINKNPFLGSKHLPKKTIAIKQTEKIPSYKELDMIENLALENMKATGKGSGLKVLGAKKALPALKILRAEGLRVGALENLNIDSDGNYIAKSKGNMIDGKLSEAIIELLAELGLDKQRPFKDYKALAFTKWFQVACKKIGLKNSYSPHSIRHRFSCDYYNRTHDIVGLMKRLSHKSLIATTAYLATLKSGLSEVSKEKLKC